MLLDAVATMRKIVRESAAIMPDERLPYDPFKLDQQTLGAETAFEIAFEYNDVRYDYSFGYLADRITHEELHRYETKSPQLLYSVVRGKETKFELTTTKRMSKLRKHEEHLKAKPNSLLLFRGAQEGVQELVDPYRWLSRGLLTYDAPFDHTDQSIFGPVIEGEFGGKMRSNLILLARQADLGIVDIRSRELPALPEEQLKEVYAPDIVQKLLGTRRKVAVFVHEGEDGSTAEFASADESVGTKSFLSAAAACLQALGGGGTLLFDEIDCSLHPKLAESLVRLFADSGWNKQGAQLLFTGHAASIMDLLRRDQVWKTSKGKDGASTLDSLSDYFVRKDERKSRGYIAGRYGSVPVVDFSIGEEV